MVIASCIVLIAQCHGSKQIKSGSSFPSVALYVYSHTHQCKCKCEGGINQIEVT